MGDEAIAWPGPFRAVSDRELPEIWYLTPQTALLFEFIPITAYPPPGADAPAVSGLLRRMLYLVKLSPAELTQLIQDMNAQLAGQQYIAIRAKLLSLLRAPFEAPWAFPAILLTADIIRLRGQMNGVVTATSIPANITSATPIAVALGLLSRFAGAATANAAYAASLTNRYYSSYVQKMDIELALRGINPATLQ